MSNKRDFLRADEPTRRDFLRGAAAGMLGVAGLPWLERVALASAGVGSLPLGAATARSVIYLYMSGGMSQLDTFDPKPGADTQGPTRAIGTNADGIQVSEHFPNVARLMDKVAVLPTLSSTQGAHLQGRYYMHTSYQLRGTIRHPSMGAWLGHVRGRENPTLPGHVCVGGDPYMAQAGYLPPEVSPLPIGDPEAGLQHSRRHDTVDEEVFQRRLDRLGQMNQSFAAQHEAPSVDAYADMYDQAVRLMGSRDLKAFDLEQEPQSLRDAYGSGSFGQGCLLARRLVEHGVRFVEVVKGGWDTHNDNFDEMGDLCPPVDRALAALLSDLDSRGLLDETLVVLATEFGRTPEIVTARQGRNHHPKSFACLLAGGGVRGGQRIGETDRTGREVVARPVSVPEFNASIAYALGLPIDHEFHSPSGRPFKISDKGRPVMELF